MVSRLGRRWLAFGTMVISGVFSLLATAVPIGKKEICNSLHSFKSHKTYLFKNKLFVPMATQKATMDQFSIHIFLLQSTKLLIFFFFTYLVISISSASTTRVGHFAVTPVTKLSYTISLKLITLHQQVFHQRHWP